MSDPIESEDASRHPGLAEVQYEAQAVAMIAARHRLDAVRADAKVCHSGLDDYPRSLSELVHLRDRSIRATRYRIATHHQDLR